MTTLPHDEASASGLGQTSPLPVPLFVGGCPRSGTTLLGAMLGVGPSYLTVPEALFKVPLLAETGMDGLLDEQRAAVVVERDEFFRMWRIDVPPSQPGSISYRTFVTQLVQAFGRREGKPDARVWIDHTPGNIRYAASLARLFPEAKFVNIVRDGRAVAASVMPLDWGPNTIADAARWWSAHIALGLAAEARLGHERVLSVKYEDLLANPRLTTQKVCRFAGLKYDRAMLEQRDYTVRDYTVTEHSLVERAPSADRANAWQTELADRRIETFEHLTGELLTLLGYDMVYGASARLGSRRHRVSDAAADVVRRGLLDKVHRRISRRGLH